MCCLCWIVVRCVLSVFKAIMCFLQFCSQWWPLKTHVLPSPPTELSTPSQHATLTSSHWRQTVWSRYTSTNIHSCSCKCTYSSKHIIWLPVDPQVDESTVRETGWLYGSYRGNSGWFPESYAERSSKESQIELTAPVTHSTAPSTNYPGYGTKTALLLTRLCNLAWLIC